MRLLSRCLAIAAAIAILPSLSQSQVVPAIKGGGAQINVYGLYSLVNPNGTSTVNYPPGTKYPSSYLDANGWNQGFTVGGDFRLGRFAWGQPALDARYTRSTGNYAGEDTIMAGPEIHYQWSRLRPYGDYMIGKGNIHYNGGFNDDSIVNEFGGGVDYHWNFRWSIRLIDFQYQLWNLGTHHYQPGLLPGQPGYTFSTKLEPYTISVGLTFRIK